MSEHEADRQPEHDPQVVRARSTRRLEPSAARALGIPDPEGRLRARDTLIEKQIRAAQERGLFDDLPHQGQPLPYENDAAAGEMASAFRILRNAGAAPPWIEADKEVRRLLEERRLLLERAGRAGPLSRPNYRQQLRELVVTLNKAVFALNHEAPTLRQHRQPLDLAAEMDALEALWRA
jgi:hypothetical protein